MKIGFPRAPGASSPALQAHKALSLLTRSPLIVGQLESGRANKSVLETAQWGIKCPCKTRWSLLPILADTRKLPAWECLRKTEQPDPPWAHVTTSQPITGAGLILPMVLVPSGGGEDAIPSMEIQKCRHSTGPGGKSSIDQVCSKDRLLKGKYLWSGSQRREDFRLRGGQKRHLSEGSAPVPCWR